MSLLSCDGDGITPGRIETFTAFLEFIFLIFDINICIADMIQGIQR